MAGDWIKMRSNLWDDPRIARLCDTTDQPEAMVIGGLYWLWSAADQHTEDGLMVGLSLRQIDRKTGIKGFGEALVAVAWIAEEGEGIRIVNFDEHNGSSAKKRAQTAKRVAKHAATNAQAAQEKGSGNAALTPTPESANAASVSDALAREREEKEKEKKENKKQSADAVRHVFDHWVAVMGKDPARTKLTDDRKKKISARLKDYPLDDLLAAIDGCAGSSFHMGDNPEGARHDGIELIFRNGEKLEGFRDMRPARLTAVPAPAPKTGNEINPYGRF